jgi:hypothetical protein
MNKRKAFWLTTLAGVIWFGIGLRDIFAPHLFRFDGRVADSSTVSLDFALGVMFLLIAFGFLQARPKLQKQG